MQLVESPFNAIFYCPSSVRECGFTPFAYNIQVKTFLKNMLKNVLGLDSDAALAAITAYGNPDKNS